MSCDCRLCCCSEFLYKLQLDVKDDPSVLLTSVCGASNKSDSNDVISRLFEGQVVNLVCVSHCTAAFIRVDWQL